MGNRSRILFWTGAAVNLIVFLLPHLVGLRTNLGDYTPFSAAPELSGLISAEETYYYAPGPSRFYHTGRLQKELDVFELRGQSNPYPVLHSVVIGLLSKGVGSLELGWMVGHALFPTLLWMILCWNAYRVEPSIVRAMAAAWLTCLVGFGPRSFLLIGAGNSLQPLALTRMPHPALSFLLLVLAIWQASRAIEHPSAGNVAAGAVVAGALFYAYFFCWVAFFAGSGALLIMLAWRREWQPARTLALVTAIGGVLGAPQIFWNLESVRVGGQSLPFGQQDLIGRRAEEFTRNPDVTGLVVVLLATVILWRYSRAKEWFPLLILATATGAAAGLNLHVLTGFDAEHGHFYNRVLQPLAFYWTALLAIQIRPRRWVSVSGALIIALLAVGAIRQVAVGRQIAIYHRASRPNHNALLWLRGRMEPDSVIGSTDMEMVSLIPTVTGTWNFVPAEARSNATNLEIVTRYLLLSRLEGKTWDFLEKSAPDLEPPEFGPDTVRLARRIWSSLDPVGELSRRKLDYLVSRRGAAASSVLRLLPGSQIVYENSEWAVIRAKAK